MTTPQELTTFSFGRNWQSFLDSLPHGSFDEAARDIDRWIGASEVRGKRVMDVGSGSGIHSLCFHNMGAAAVVSFDYDSQSVEATRRMWRSAGEPANWTVLQGSILDTEFIGQLGAFDIVYAWGVLHHTGAIWKAVESAISLLGDGGFFWVALYAKGPRYAQDLALKRKYNAASPIIKKLMLWSRIVVIMLACLRHLQNPFRWNRQKRRGMDVYHDLIDWLGGLPYEVASENEVVLFCRHHGLVLEKIEARGEGACSTYVFSRMRLGALTSCVE